MVALTDRKNGTLMCHFSILFMTNFLLLIATKCFFCEGLQ